MDVLGIDFGTSNTVAVLAGSGRPPRVLGIDGSGWIPSCVYIDDDGTLAVGRDAERKARLSPERYEANPKRRIDDGEILLGVRIVSVVDAIAAVLHRVVDEARRQLNGRSPDQIHLTHPAEWGPSRRNVLMAAARAAGLGPSVVLLPEPVAAAAHFWALADRQLTPGTSLAVYDLGGGTFDCAVVGSTPSGFLVLAEAGLATVGGVDFDQAVIDHVGRTVSGQDPARWQALVRPRNAADRRAARTLREDVRAAKETLSRYAQTDLSLPEPFDDTLLTRREFEGLIRPVLAQTVELLAGTIARAGLTAEQLGGIYLVGGSSRIPLVATMIGEQLRIVPTTLDQPETAVAMGAALMPVLARQQGRTDVGVDGHARPKLSGPVGGAPPDTRPPAPTRPMSGSPFGPVSGSTSGPTAGPMSGPAAGPAAMSTGPGPVGADRPADPPGSDGSTAGRQLTAAPGDGGRPSQGGTRRTRVLIGAVGVAVLLIAAIVVIIARSGSGSGPTDIAGRSTSNTAFTPASPTRDISSSASAGSSSAGSSSNTSRTSASSTSGAPTSTPPTSTSRTSSSRPTAPRTSASRTSTRPSTSRPSSTSSPPAGCSNPNATTGLTPCMKQVVGTMADLSCSKNPSAIGLDATALTQLQTLTSAFSTCIDSSKGFAAVIFQTNDNSGRYLLGSAVVTQFTVTQQGTWKGGGRSGRFSVGRTPTGITLLEWEDSQFPIVAFIGATKGAGIDETVNYWTAALGATVTG